MKETYVELDIPFSTANTIGKAEILYSDRKLYIDFKQFNDKQLTIEFEDVIGFRWDNKYLSRVTEPPDRVYEIQNSVWMAELEGEFKINKNHFYHYKLYFITEAAALDVVASSMKRKA